MLSGWTVLPAAAAGAGDFASDLEDLRLALGIPGMAAAVVSDGAVVFAEGFGYSDVENQVPATADTPFGLASVTKPIAATLTMQLVEEEVVGLDTPIADYGVRIPDDPGITVRHLLTHTSEGTPGKVHTYNGDRYGLLGRVIAGATGRSFADLLGDRILVPLQMNDSALGPFEFRGVASIRGFEDLARSLGWSATFANYPDVYRRLARPYQFGEDFEIVPGMYHLQHSPAAGLNAGVGDLAAFDIALDRGELLGANARAEMWSPQVRTVLGRSDLNYGLGWYVQDLDGLRLLWHTGRWPPSTSALYLKVPDYGLTFIVAANTDNLTVPFFGIGDGDISRSAPALVFLRHFVYSAELGGELPTIDWSMDRPELLDAVADVDDTRARLVLERELWSFRQAFASSGQTDQAEILRRVAITAFPGSPLARDPETTATVGRQPVVAPLASTSSLVWVSRAMVGWMVVVVAALGWMVLRLLRCEVARAWDWAVWLVATALVGPVGPVVHRATVRRGWEAAPAALMSVAAYGVAWMVAMGLLMSVGGEPHPALTLGATVALPIIVGLVAVRAPLFNRWGGGYALGLRRGLVAEVITWGIGFALFFTLTFVIDARWLSTIPTLSSPYFGAMMSMLALTALVVFVPVHRLFARSGFDIWPAAATVQGEPPPTLRLPTLRTAWWMLVAAVLVMAASLAATVALLD